jgi:predicted nucleic acid-binding protein
MRIFVDTNVIVYARDRGSAEKRAKARRWLRYLAEREWAVVNLQVVNETIDVLLRRSAGMNEEDIRNHAEELLALGDTPVDMDEIALAWEIRARFGFRWWDCLMLAAALLLECSHVVTEDLQHGQAVGRLTIVNPFHATPESLGWAS